MKILPFSDLEKRLCRSKQSIRSLYNNGKLPFVFRVNGRLYFEESDFSKWIESNSQYKPNTKKFPNPIEAIKIAVESLKKAIAVLEYALDERDTSESQLPLLPPQTPGNMKNREYPKKADVTLPDPTFD